MKRILFIENDLQIKNEIKRILQSSGFYTITTTSGKVGAELAKGDGFDAIIVDLFLNDETGIECCKDLRKHNLLIPIIFLTNNKEEDYQIEAFNSGADDFINYPVHKNEFIARLNAIIRRSKIYLKSYDEASFSNIRINFTKQITKVKNKQILLTSTEYKILKFFVEREEEVISRAEIIDALWGVNSNASSRTIDNYMLSIRKKIEKNPSCPKHIITVFNEGYKFVK